MSGRGRLCYQRHILGNLKVSHKIRADWFRRLLSAGPRAANKRTLPSSYLRHLQSVSKWAGWKIKTAQELFLRCFWANGRKLFAQKPTGRRPHELRTRTRPTIVSLEELHESSLEQPRNIWGEKFGTPTVMRLANSPSDQGFFQGASNDLHSPLLLRDFRFRFGGVHRPFCSSCTGDSAGYVPKLEAGTKNHEHQEQG